MKLQRIRVLSLKFQKQEKAFSIVLNWMWRAHTCSMSVLAPGRRRCRHPGPYEGPYDQTTATSMTTPLKNRLRIPFQTILQLSQVAQLLKRREVMLEQKRGGHSRVQERDGRIYRLAVPVLKKNLKFGHVNWVVVVLGRQRNVQKSEMYVRSCCFAK